MFLERFVTIKDMDLFPPGQKVLWTCLVIEALSHSKLGP